MKRMIYSMLSLLVLALTACDKADDFTGIVEVLPAPQLDGISPAEQKVKEMYTKYNVLFKPTFTVEEYSWNWDDPVAYTSADVTGLRFSPADLGYVIPVVDSVEKWVFKIFPLEFSKKHLPLNILMADTMGNKFTSATGMVYRPFEGYITNNYILVSYVSQHFNTLKNQRILPESWLSLFVEKMLPSLPAPTAFATVSQTGYNSLIFSNALDVVTTHAILKKGRTKQTLGTPTSAWAVTKMAQDFGDFVAFIVYTPEVEKATVYAKNANVLIKVNLVKAYFLENFNIELPYIPIAQ